jgi:hypothetical protein
MVGVEYYVGKLDMVSKVLQVIIIGMSIYLIFATRKNMIKGSVNLKSYSRSCSILHIAL